MPRGPAHDGALADPGSCSGAHIHTSADMNGRNPERQGGCTSALHDMVMNPKSFCYCDSFAFAVIAALLGAGILAEHLPESFHPMHQLAQKAMMPVPIRVVPAAASSSPRVGCAEGIAGKLNRSTRLQANRGCGADSPA